MKQIRVFMFGDYAFLCSAYGITGANGKYYFHFVSAPSENQTFLNLKH